ncbi:MAG: tRNA (adenosine(37)-N6)-threonylcarbamoyltransferase complex transferase subunit TsaD [Spirochaetaceae bacterium]|nr:tRNA (adenosine(37)-N6)-threonylcarbamoyltransferase complex transferase subunit TsaD [Spirochaetaceae bacterium]
MNVLGIETSCDECAAAVVADGRHILSNVVLTQIPFHAGFAGVVPEIASRKHTEWILSVVHEAISQAGISIDEVDAAAAASHPGLSGSLLVGLTFAKAFAWARHIPLVACDHILAHLYASRLIPPVAAGAAVVEAAAGKANGEAARTAGCGDTACEPPDYPFLGLLVSGGHTIICRAERFDRITVLGTTIDDAAGEAFDKVARHYGLGYPGGVAIDRLAQNGNPNAYRFPIPRLHKGNHRFDVSYSGIKTAAINQLDLFRAKDYTVPADEGQAKADIAASFQKTAVEILAAALLRAVEYTGITTVVAGGGVAANSCLRARLAARNDLRFIFPPLPLCGDNGAMVAGLAYRFLEHGIQSPLSVTVRSRIPAFRKAYP